MKGNSETNDDDNYWTREELLIYVEKHELILTRAYQEFRAKKIVENIQTIKALHWIMTKKYLQSQIAYINDCLEELLDNAELPSHDEYGQMSNLCLVDRYYNIEELKVELKIRDWSLYRKAYGKMYFSKKPLINLCGRIKTTIMEFNESVKRMIRKKVKEVAK